jgi:hypothetical protein
MFHWSEPRFAGLFQDASKHATAMALGASGNYNPLRRDFMRSASIGRHRERGVCQMAT